MNRAPLAVPAGPKPASLGRRGMIPRMKDLAAFRLDGRVAAVVGAGSGIGAAVAEACARQGARVVLCGRISQTHAAEPYGVRNLGRLAAAHGRMQGFLVFRYHERYEEARTWLAARRRDGSLRQRIHVLEGLAQAPIGLGMLFRGENTGKLVVRVAAG